MITSRLISFNVTFHFLTTNCIYAFLHGCQKEEQLFPSKEGQDKKTDREEKRGG